jgi:hypothetical protein
MTDVAIGEALPELVPLIPPPAPEAAAELEDVPPQAAAVEGLAPVADQGAVAPTEFAPGVDESSSERPSVDARAALEIEHPIGATRQAILDHFLDSDSPEQSMSQIKAGLPNVLPGTIEACVRRELLAERLLRTRPGVYKLAPAKSPEQPKPAPQPPPTPTDEATWFAALDGWINDPETWDRERFGPRPDEPGRRIPAGVVAKGVDRNRKRQERRREAEAAGAKRAAADAELRAKLLATCNGNYLPGAGLDDMAPIKAILELVPVDYILYAIRQKVDKRCFPGNPPLTSWSDPKFLRAVADNYCGGVVIPSMVAAWEAAGKAPATKTHQSLPPVRHMPDDIDRSHHDSEHAPPGPHSLPKPPAASAAQA